MFRRFVLALSLAAVAVLTLPAVAADPSALDAITVYAPDGTYSWIGETLGLDAARGTYGRAGTIVFGDGGIPPVVNGPRIWPEAGPRSEWSLELSPSGAIVTGCQLYDIDYKLASGAHVYLRCGGPPQ